MLFLNRHAYNSIVNNNIIHIVLTETSIDIFFFKEDSIVNNGIKNNFLCTPIYSWSFGVASFWIDTITETGGFSWWSLAISVYSNVPRHYDTSTLVSWWSFGWNWWWKRHVCGGGHNTWLLFSYPVMYFYFCIY